MSAVELFHCVFMVLVGDQQKFCFITEMYWHK